MKLTRLHKCFQYLANLFSWVFSSRLNPLHHLGAIAILLLIIDTISGFYLYIFYKIDPRYSYSSVEAISSGMMGNIMRGLHRYSSAALILTVLIHAMNVLMTDRFRMFRWVAWFTGIISLLIFLVTGISGYILVWDTKAQLIGILSGKILGYLPIFGDAIMSTFFGSDIKYLGGLFRMLLYAHVALTILIVFILWIHVLRNARPRLMPPRFIWLGITAYMVLLSIILPAKSDPEAVLSHIPFEISIDWFYFFIYPLMKVMPISWMWAILGGILIILTLFPWLVRGWKNPVVVMDPERCTGCERCYIDCPYEAVIMSGTGGKKKSKLLEKKCAGCGICIGSCSFKAIDLSVYPWQKVIEEIREKSPEVVVMRCPFSATPPSGKEIAVYTVPCVGAVHVNHAKEILRYTKGLFLVSCEQEDCYYREGSKWTIERYEKRRKPFLEQDVDQRRIRILEAPHVRDISKELELFINDLRESKEEKNGGKVSVRGFNKLNYAAASVVLLVPAFIFYPLTNYRMAFYPEDKSAIIISFKYRSTQALATGRSPVKIEFFVGDKPTYSKSFYPRGIRRDASIFVYDEIILKPEAVPMTLRMEETLFPEKKSELKIVEDLKPKKSLVITYDEATKNFAYLK